MLFVSPYMVLNFSRGEGKGVKTILSWFFYNKKPLPHWRKGHNYRENNYSAVPLPVPPRIFFRASPPGRSFSTPREPRMAVASYGM